VIFAASGDLGNFSGHKQGEPEYEALVTRIHDVVLKAGISWVVAELEGPPGLHFFRLPAKPSSSRRGARVNLGLPPAPSGLRGKR